MYRWLLLAVLSVLAVSQWGCFAPSSGPEQEFPASPAAEQAATSLSSSRFAYPIQAEKPTQASGIHFSVFQRSCLPIFGAIAKVEERLILILLRQFRIESGRAFLPAVRKALLLFPFHHFW